MLTTYRTITQTKLQNTNNTFITWVIIQGIYALKNTKNSPSDVHKIQSQRLICIPLKYNIYLYKIYT